MNDNKLLYQNVLDEQQEQEEENKAKLSRETIGTKAKGKYKDKLTKKQKLTIGAIAVSAGVLGFVLRGIGNSDNKSNNNNQVTSNTSITTTTEITTTEKQYVVSISDETTTKEFITTSAPEIVVTKASTTPEVSEVSVTTTTPEIVVTKVSTTTETPVIVETDSELNTTVQPVAEDNKVVEEDKTVETTTTTTTKPIVTEEKKEEEKPAKPITIKNIDKKVKLFKETCKKAGLVVKDEWALNAVRVLHSDFIAHDGYKEITAVQLEQVLSLYASIGSVNYFELHERYTGSIPKVEECVYIPAEVFPEEVQQDVKDYIKLSEQYRKDLNKIPSVQITITEKEEKAIMAEVQEELDWYYVNGIKDINEYQDKYEKMYLKLWKEKYAQKEAEATYDRKLRVKEAYEDLYDATIKYLFKTDDYLNLSPSVKYGIFTNMAGALASGVDENSKKYTKYQEFTDGIGKAIDKTREDLIVANRKNINQDDALQIIIENNIETSKEEREDLAELKETIIAELEDGKVLIR